MRSNGLESGEASDRLTGARRSNMILIDPSAKTSRWSKIAVDVWREDAEHSLNRLIKYMIPS